MRVHAAGSLRVALTAAAPVFRARGGPEVHFEFGASGTLRDRIARGEATDVFASANMEHPLALFEAGLAGPVRAFARNRLCALAPSKLGVASANVLDRMLDPAIKLGTSTPKADPSGDYAWEVFRRAEALRPGTFETLSRKALQLVGGPNAPSPPANRTIYGVLVARGDADLFLTYCTGTRLAATEEPTLASIDLPAALAVGADYGLVVMKDARREAQAFADFLLGPEGRAVLARAGFDLPD